MKQLLQLGNKEKRLGYQNPLEEGISTWMASAPEWGNEAASVSVGRSWKTQPTSTVTSCRHPGGLPSWG